MRRATTFAALAVLVGASAACTRGSSAPSPPEPARADAAALLDGCAREVHEGATTWSCGEAFLVLDANVAGAATDDAIGLNLRRFVESFGDDVVARDDAPWVQGGVAHRAARVRVAIPEKGRFVATMIVVAREGGARVLSCSAKESEGARCDAVLGALLDGRDVGGAAPSASGP